MELGPGEPAAGPWRVESLDVFARSLVETAGTPAGRPRIIAVDGRGGGGKTALAERLGRMLPARLSFIPTTWPGRILVSAGTT